jgi:hypothetical protein
MSVIAHIDPRFLLRGLGACRKTRNFSRPSESTFGTIPIWTPHMWHARSKED